MSFTFWAGFPGSRADRFAMSYSLDFSVAEKYLHVSMKGKWPRRHIDGLLGELLGVWNRHERKPMLLDLRNVIDAPTVLDDYQYAREFAEAGFIDLGRIAVLDETSRRDANEFFITASANRGLSFRFFYNGKAEALDWLLAGDEK